MTQIDTHILYTTLLKQRLIPSTTHLYHEGALTRYVVTVDHPRQVQLRYTYNAVGDIVSLDINSAYGDVTDKQRFKALSLSATYRLRTVNDADDIARLSAQLYSTAVYVPAVHV